jgi:hypothetical protein
MKGDEDLQRPITNRQQDAILPHMRLSSQGEAFDRAAAFQAAFRTLPKVPQRSLRNSSGVEEAG